MGSGNHELTEGALILERYRVIGHLGSGAMGEVYKAHDSADERTVALKLLSASQMINAESLARFRSEFELMKRLAHPNIIAAFDLHEMEDGRLIMALEYVEGRTLSAVIHQSEAPLEVKERLNTLLDIARGLEHAHQQGLIHRDLKPDNVLISSEGTAKILDFGVARHTEQDLGLTLAGAMIGTQRYMSPEQFRGEKVDQRTDIFSFGLVAYELLSGVVPFKSVEETPLALYAAHAAGELPSVRESNADAPKWVDRFIEVCTAPDRAHRYASMTDIVDLLEQRMGVKPSKSMIMSILGR